MAEYTGTVTTYGMKKGYGFISCSQFSKDVFFLRGSLPPELSEGFYPELDFQLKGSAVTFQVQYSNDQQPQAVSIKLLTSPDKPVVGTVKTYNATKGYGFLTCSSVEGQDVFFSKKDLPLSLQMVDLKDEKCSFIVQTKPDGKMQASSLKFKKLQQGNGNGYGNGGGGYGMKGGGGGYAMSMPQQPMQDTGKGGGKGMGYGMGYGMGGMQMGGMPMPAQPAPGTQEEHGMQGTVISYNAALGYGFIKSAKVPQDIYFKESGGQWQPGVAVAFNLRMNRDGKPSASNLVLGLSNGQACSGSIKSFNAAKGWGFIKVDGSPADVYFIKDLVPPNLLSGNIIGLKVQFTVQLAADGKPRAAPGLQFL
eukprot:TRINITY_DN22261_c0_g1_i1.p2 TRINITY_DN22261_c0_g1~~TRINITY_DN22261_c0_g1_i1.p2  ORF type:complete len:364 (-),score=93.85 TRINITY_DN22261_c0_g1_i1:251-1342(-)